MDERAVKEQRIGHLGPDEYAAPNRGRAARIPQAPFDFQDLGSCDGRGKRARGERAACWNLGEISPSKGPRAGGEAGRRARKRGRKMEGITLRAHRRAEGCMPLGPSAHVTRPDDSGLDSVSSPKFTPLTSLIGSGGKRGSPRALCT